MTAPEGWVPLVESQTREPRLLDRVRLAIRARHYSLRTEEAYVVWIKRYIFFHGKRHPKEMGEPEINAFLSDLAVKRQVSASTQNQALAALLFLYRHVLAKSLPDLAEVVRVKRPRRLPVVLTRAEVRAVIGRMGGTPRLVATLLYGSGVRLLECLRLRVKDVEFGSSRIVVRDAKGQRDRVAPLPLVVRSALPTWLARVKRLHEKDPGRRVRKRLPAGSARAQVPRLRKGLGLAVAFPRRAQKPRPSNPSRATPPPRRERDSAGRPAGGRRYRDLPAGELPHFPAPLRDPPDRGRI